MEQTADTCADCARRNICQPDKPYTGFCQWRESVRKEKKYEHIKTDVK